MNKRLQDYARKCLLEDLAKLPEDWQTKFKLIYGRTNNLQVIEDIKKLSIENVVECMSENSLDRAMQQVENSLEKLGIVVPNDTIQ